MTNFKSLATWALAGLSAGLAVAAPSASPESFKIDKRYVEVRDDITYNVFEHAETGTKLSFVNNSGICETTPGVNQYSGYLTVGTNMNMWFCKSTRPPELEKLRAFTNPRIQGSLKLATMPARHPWPLGSTVDQDAAP